MVREKTRIYFNNDENDNTKKWANCHKIKARQIKNGKIKIHDFQVVEYVPNSLDLFVEEYIVHHSGTPDTYSGTIDSDGNVRITKHSGTSASSEKKARTHIYCEADILYYDENHRRLYYETFGKKWRYVTIVGLWISAILVPEIASWCIGLWLSRIGFYNYANIHFSVITPILVLLFVIGLIQIKLGKFTIFNILFRPIKFIKLCNYNNKVKKEVKSIK